MVNKFGIEEGTPLANVLQNWGKIYGTAQLSKKHAVALFQKEWPFITREAGGALSEILPPHGTFSQLRLTYLQHHLEDESPCQMDCWYIWDNWAWARRHPAKGRGIRPGVTVVVMAVDSPNMSHPTFYV